MQNLPVARYRFRVRMHKALTLPAFSGSLMRSVFGRALKQIACAAHGEEPCPPQCAYKRLFDPERPVDGRFPENPPPYVIEPPRQTRIEAGQQLQFAVVLLGDALDDLPIVVQAWQQALTTGLGGQRASGQLLDVTLINNESCITVFSTLDCRFQPHSPRLNLLSGSGFNRCQLHFLTPLRLQQQKQFLKPEALTPELLAKALLRRIRLAGELYLGLKLPDWHQFAHWFEAVSMKSDLQWQTVERYSSRQQQSMKLGGLTGIIAFENLHPQLAPWLLLGQYLHLGKNSSFGFGQYHLTTMQEQ